MGVTLSAQRILGALTRALAEAPKTGDGFVRAIAVALEAAGKLLVVES